MQNDNVTRVDQAVPKHKREEVKHKIGVKPQFWSPARFILAFFAALIAIGTLLLSLPFATHTGQSVGVLTAFFTSTSAVCVTGLVRVDTASTWTLYGQIVIVLLMQFGGLGFANSSMLVLLLLHRRPHLTQRLALQTATGSLNRRGVVKLAVFVIKITLVIEAIGALLLFVAWVGTYGGVKAAWWAVFHSISAFTNGSFDITGTPERPFTSFTGFVDNPVVNLTIAGLIICGGLGFAVFAEMLDFRRERHLSVQTRVLLVGTVVLLAGGTFVIWLAERTNPRTLETLPLPIQIMAAFFQSVVPRTSGFTTIDVTQMRPTSLLLIILLMIVGGGSNSMAGGIKIGTAAVVLFSLRATLLNKPATVLFKKTIPARTVAQAYAVAALYIFGIISITIGLTLTEKLPVQLLLFETVSAFGTVGLSLGATPQLSGAGMLLLAVAMFVGRLGPIVLLVAFSSTRPHTSHVRRPEEDFAIT